MDEPLKVGQWYLLSYGFAQVQGRCSNVLPEGGTFEFRWGGPFRQTHYVGDAYVLGRVRSPTVYAKLWRLFNE